MKKEYTVLFLIFCVLCISNISNICKVFPLTYDNQIFFTWEYTAWRGMLPYRDIFFPYGIFYYYKNTNLVFAFLYYFLTPVLFTYFTYVFFTITKEKRYSYIFGALLFVFIYLFTGFESFTRYGVLIALGFLFGSKFFSGKLSQKTLLLLGVLSGIVFSLLNDQGIYSIAVYISLMLFDLVVRQKKKSVISRVFSFAQRVLVFLLGFFIGFLPYAIYLLQNNSFIAFFKALAELSDLTLIAKTPFFHGFATTDNIFAFSILFVSIFYLSYKVIFQKKEITLGNYIEFALLIILLIIEQKNIIRAIDRQVTLISFMLLLILLYEIPRIRQKLIYLVIPISIVLFGLRLHPFPTYPFNNACMDYPKRFSVQNNEFVTLKKEVKALKGFDGKVFSYPGDMVIYMLFNQLPPYYPTIYEGSSKAAQEKLISYIQQNNIKYVIYHYTYTAIQDEVPNYVRGSYIHSYIMTNFHPVKRVGNFVILSKDSKPQDIFMDKNFTQIKPWYEDLTNIDFENIPRSEGLYKHSKLVGKELVHGSQETVDRYLQSHNVTSDNLFLTITFRNTIRQKSTIIFQTNNKLQTTVTFSSCERGVPCIIHVQKLPLFYQSRQIQMVSFERADSIENISLMHVKDAEVFW